MTIRFEYRPVVICQCILPCFQPFQVGEEWSDVGCLKPKGHEGEHGVDGPGEITYRDPSAPSGPRVVLRNIEGTSRWSGQCYQCQRKYYVNATDADASGAGTVLD